MSLVIKFHFTSSMFNMFRTLIHPSSGACDFSIVSPHWSCVLVWMCVGVSVWLGWGGIRVAGWSLILQLSQLMHGPIYTRLTLQLFENYRLFHKQPTRYNNNNSFNNFNQLNMFRAIISPIIGSTRL